MFTHIPLPKIELIRSDLPTGRVYLTPNGNYYPSVTRVIGFEPKPAIEEWKIRVGEAEAKAVSNRAAARGTLIHSYAEDYLNNKTPNVSMFDLDMWRKFKRVLDHIDNVRMIEGKMYSDKLQLAGTTDCIGDYDKILSIIDVKTSLRLKCENDIFGYFLQTTIYAMMAYERYGIAIKQIVILIAVDNEEPQVFIRNVGQYIKPSLQIIKKYYDHVKSLSIIHPVVL